MVTVASTVDPFRKLTVPVCAPAVVEFTWAVKTTGMVASWVVGLAENVIAESARAETDSELDVDAAKPALPEYTAVIALGPSGKLRLNVAMPCALMAWAPSRAVPA
jgi:hypothetical protein